MASPTTETSGDTRSRSIRGFLAERCRTATEDAGTDAGNGDPLGREPVVAVPGDDGAAAAVPIVAVPGDDGDAAAVPVVAVPGDDGTAAAAAGRAVNGPEGRLATPTSGV